MVHLARKKPELTVGAAQNLQLGMTDMAGRQIIFVAVFMTFLSQCVNYSKIPGSKKLTDPGVLVPQCTKKISGMPNVAIWLFTLSVFFRIYQLLLDYPRLRHMKEFYEHLLGIPDADMQTISWQEIIARIMALRDDNPATAERISSRNRKFIDTQSKQRLDAHDIANRLMRKDNYLIAMFNKEILNLDINLPFLRGRQISADWFLITLDWCIMDLVFNKQGQVQQLILKDTHRKELSKALRNRFLFAGYMHLIVSPLLLIYLVIIYFLKYFNVSLPSHSQQVELSVPGISKKSIQYWCETIYFIGTLEIPRVQRSSSSLS